MAEYVWLTLDLKWDWTWLLLIQFRHKVTNLLQVWRSRLPVGESKLNDSPATNGEINNHCDWVVHIWGSLQLYEKKTHSFWVRQQMERTFPMDIFRNIWNTFRAIPLFSFLPKWSQNHCTICSFALFPHARWWNTQLFRWEMTGNSPFHWKVFKSCQILHTHPVLFCLLKFCTVPSGGKFSLVFHANGKHSSSLVLLSFNLWFLLVF